MTTCKPYNEKTAEDFKQLYVKRFPGGDLRIPELVLTNPVRKGGFDAGSVAYEDDGKVVAIHGLFLRALFYGRTPIKAANGVALAVRKDAQRDFFTGFVRDSVKAAGADLFFANTSVPGSRKRGAAALGMQDGPVSCSEIRERTVRNNGRLSRLLRKVCGIVGRNRSAPRQKSELYHVEIRGMMCVIENEIAANDFNAFWESYLEKNEGLVSSRTAEELRWMFGLGLSTGEVILLTARKDGVLQGYAFLRRTDETASCWRVVDLVARGNDEGVLESLIEGATRYLRHDTLALCLQITGYPMWVQPLLRRLFPKSSSFGFNKCTWAYLDDRTASMCGDWVNAENGWYGCPYDGDMCLI